MAKTRGRHYKADESDKSESEDEVSKEENESQEEVTAANTVR